MVRDGISGDAIQMNKELHHKINEHVIPKGRYSYEIFRLTEEEKSEIWRLKNLNKAQIRAAGQNPGKVMNVRPK